MILMHTGLETGLILFEKFPYFYLSWNKFRLKKN